jgi:hypothetical protein
MDRLIAHGGATRPADSRETGGTFGFFTAKEGTMNADIWIELAIVLLRILAVGLSG